ncbi:F0F1 ATP synthase subunit delta [Schaalia vaccimaxillae]|uniref:F0F1 ATP synthase subunit delta n=1 Tax=Schaalia vaccimaxillae TaxID=183916 RepID=UPI0003B2FB37|nr:F0F1 ATP synthase subunit delta [Schaalia vaccimaxillae]
MTQIKRIESVAYAHELDSALATPGVDAMKVAEDFFGLADIVRADSRLLRAMTDPARSHSDKENLVRQAFGGHVQDSTMKVVTEVTTGHWSNPDDVFDTFEVLGILSVLTDALRQGQLEQVEEELFAVRQVLADERQLRIKLSDSDLAGPHERGDLASSIFADRVSVWTMRLVRRAVGRSKHGRLLINLRRFAEWSATMQNRLLVTVESAVPLSHSQIERLHSLLQRRFDNDISLAFSIKPDVIGGFRLRAGTTAIDASLATRIDDMRRQLVG